MHPESGGWTDTEQKYPPPPFRTQVTGAYKTTPKQDEDRQK